MLNVPYFLLQILLRPAALEFSPVVVYAACASLQHCLCCCRDQAPWQARAATFAAAVRALGDCMATRHSAAARGLWRAAAAAFNAVVAAGLPAVNIAYVNRGDRELPHEAWPALTCAFSTLLLGYQPQHASATEESKVGFRF